MNLNISAMYSCRMPQPPALPINLQLNTLTVPVRMSPSITVPPFLSSVPPILPPPSYQLMCSNSKADEADVDVVGITDAPCSVHLDNGDEDEEEPLDLSIKKKEICCAPSSSSVLIPPPNRPTVIKNGYGK
ncbi:unnamed protein product [Gongylonema pulchrum]|uniref:Ovule protein n=1 Tax=Gongylonema pulchrum TaxID=637853 RepID=A0A183DN71_9BILA|nr:unnamed protein product [Gongylonema pulchrum]